MEIALIVVIIAQIISSVAIYNLHRGMQELVKGDLCKMAQGLAMSETLMKHEVRISELELVAHIEQQNNKENENELQK